MHDLALVRRAQLALQVAGRPAEQLRDLLGVEVDQAAGDRHAVGRRDVDRLAGVEGALDRGDAGGEQRGPPLDHRADGTGVEHERALGLGRVGQPEEPGRAAAAGGVEEGADRLPRQRRAGVVGRGEHHGDARRRSRSGRRRPWSACRRCRAPAAPVLPMRTSPRSSTDLTSEISELPGSLGSASYRPSTSLSRTSRSACTRWATSAASRSLSPNRISLVATVSFSLTIGSTPYSSSLAKVW